MNNLALSNSIVEILSDAYPSLEIGVFDSTGRMTAHFPDKIVHRLSATPYYSIAKTGRFIFTIPLNKNLYLSFTGKESNVGDPLICKSIIEKTIQLFLKKEILSNQNYFQNDPSSICLSHVLNASNDEDISYVSLYAERYNYDFSIPRVVILLEFTNILQNISTAGKEQSDSLEILNKLRKLLTHYPGSLTCCLSHNQFVLCSPIKPSEHCSIKKQSELIVNNLRKLFGSDVWIGIGNIALNVIDYKNALQDAKDTLKLAKCFHNSSQLCYLEDYVLEYEFLKFPKHILQHFFNESTYIIHKTSWMLPTMKALVENNMNQKQASAALYIHRNTLVFRINQIREKLHIDPYANSNERFTFIAMYIYACLNQ